MLIFRWCTSYRVGLTHSFVCNRGYDFIPINGIGWWYVIVFIQSSILLWPMVLIIIALALTYFRSIFNEIIMIILIVGTWYDLFRLNCQKGKIYRYLRDVFLMLWTLLGLGRDTLHLYFSCQYYGCLYWRKHNLNL